MANIRHLFYIDSTINEVYEKLSKIEFIQQWWTPQTTGTDEEGGFIDLKFGDRGFIQLRPTKVNSPNELVWECIDAHPEWHGTVMEFKLEEEDGRSKIYFVHRGWKEETEFMGLCSFSWARYFISLKNLCENGQGEPFNPNV
ncbi:MAG: SRPBCC domain-containing protein [Flavobacteriales bacterium]|nr:SRPBCC domain-containing protein [Flavobacteriales bacterium]